MIRRDREREKVFRRNLAATQISSGKFLLKLERTINGRREVHPTAGNFVGVATVGPGGKPVNVCREAQAWASRFPGWEVVFG